MINNNEKKELIEGSQLFIFVKLYNTYHKTDYVLKEPAIQASIVDREMQSIQNKRDVKIIQLKSVTHFDKDTFKETGLKMMDRNIFNLLVPEFKKIQEHYGDIRSSNTKDVILVLEIGVSEEWVRDFIIPDEVKNSNFQEIYVLGLPSNLCSEGYIYKLK